MNDMKEKIDMPKSSITSYEQFTKRRISLAKWGMSYATLSAMAMVVLSLFNSGAQDTILAYLTQDVFTIMVLSWIAVGFMEFFGGVVILITKLMRGTPLAEYGRCLRIKKSTIFGLGIGFFGGPMATACMVIGVSMAGITYSNALIALAPMFASVAARIIYKDRPSTRAWLGVVIAIIGAIIASFSPPEGVENFYLGIFFSILAPIFFTIEGMIDAKVMDVYDPLVTCSLYRCILGGTWGFVISFVCCLVTGKMDTWLYIWYLIFSSPWILFCLIVAIIAVAFQYGTFFLSVNYSGPGKAMVLVWTTPIWSIPIGFMLSPIFEYNVTFMGIIGAIIVVVGMVLIVMKPSELVKVRNL